MWKTWVGSLSGEDLLEEDMATHCSILACRISWTGESGRLQSMRPQGVWHDWATNTSLSPLIIPPLFQNYYFVPLYRSWEKVMAPHSSILAWKIPWVEEPGRLQSMGWRRVGHNWATSLFTFMHWGRKWQPTPVFLPGDPGHGGAWWAAICGVTHSWTWLKWLSSSSSSTPFVRILFRKM